MKKYTLDQIVSEQYVFLERPDEVNQLVILKEKINTDLKEGDIVTISTVKDGYDIKLMEKETKDALEKVNELLAKLKNKNN